MAEGNGSGAPAPAPEPSWEITVRQKAGSLPEVAFPAWLDEERVGLMLLQAALNLLAAQDQARRQRRALIAVPGVVPLN
jgi:hypothetical protein